MAATAERRSRLTGDVAAFIRRSVEGGDSEEEFERLALEVFAFQYESIEPYRNLCRRLGRTPAEVTSWRAIPAVPAQAFKQFRLSAAGTDDVVKTFRSSGTTDPTRSSQAHFTRAGLDLMDAAVAANAGRSLFPDGRRTRILVLTPPPDQVPFLIMVHGMAHIVRTFGLEESRFMGGPGGLDFAEVRAELERCQRAGVPVSLLGSSFGFVHLFDWMEREGHRFALPAGSRLMDAGGYKGRSREIGRDAFVGWASSMLGLAADRVINLLGMTEMASQIYDRVRAGSEAGPARMKAPPSWVRTQVVDPRRAGADGPQPVESGAVGLLRHLDLANVERPSAVQSEDMARAIAAEPGARAGFEIIGRARGAEARGCSLTAEDLHRPAAPAAEVRP
jgi:hypothetical protein